MDSPNPIILLVFIFLKPILEAKKYIPDQFHLIGLKCHRSHAKTFSSNSSLFGSGDQTLNGNSHQIMYFEKPSLYCEF